MVHTADEGGVVGGEGQFVEGHPRHQDSGEGGGGDAAQLGGQFGGERMAEAAGVHGRGDALDTRGAADREGFGEQVGE